MRSTTTPPPAPVRVEIGGFSESPVSDGDDDDCPRMGGAAPVRDEPGPGRVEMGALSSGGNRGDDPDGCRIGGAGGSGASIVLRSSSPPGKRGAAGMFMRDFDVIVGGGRPDGRLPSSAAPIPIGAGGGTERGGGAVSAGGWGCASVLRFPPGSGIATECSVRCGPCFSAWPPPSPMGVLARVRVGAFAAGGGIVPEPGIVMPMREKKGSNSAIDPSRLGLLVPRASTSSRVTRPS